jgi:hypothetical protein
VARVEEPEKKGAGVSSTVGSRSVSGGGGGGVGGVVMCAVMVYNKHLARPSPPLPPGGGRRALVSLPHPARRGGGLTPLRFGGEGATCLLYARQEQRPARVPWKNTREG